MDPDARDDPAPDTREPAADPHPDLEEPAAADLRRAAEELDGLDDRPLAEHVAVYEGLHARLQTALRTVEE